MVAIVALAGTPAGANANETVEVLEQHQAEHCVATSVAGSHMATGGCHLRVVGVDIELLEHVFGIEQHALACDMTFSLRLAEDGTGYITSMATMHGSFEADSGCEQLRPCVSEGTHGETHPATEGNEAGEHAWPFEMEEVGATGSEAYEAHVVVCMHSGGAIEECEGEVDLHVYEEHPASDPEHLLEAETIGNSGHTHGEASVPEGSSTFSTHCEWEGHFNLEPEEEIHISHPGA